MRTNVCGELGLSDLGKQVVLCGWIQSRRDHGGIYFFDLRDRSGRVQIVVNPNNKQAFLEAENLGSEDSVKVAGMVQKRPEGTQNLKLATGEVEINATEILVLNRSKTLPFEIDDELQVSEEIRLKYRFLDLRRPKMLRNMTLRHKIAITVRKELDRMGFLEIETPILTKATPEGARDFLVPSRLTPGSFYALPQSPQVFKQVLMASGIERYFQLARAFRDEDLRSDRQPEHTQIDLEMSFVKERDVHAIVETFLKAVFMETLGVEIQTPFPEIEHTDIMRRYGSDKPDLRYAFEIQDATDLFKASNFKVFAGAVSSGGVVRGISVATDFPRAQIDKLTELAKSFGAKGLAWIKWESSGPTSPIVKFLKAEEISGLKALFDCKAGDTTFFVADKTAIAEKALGALRKELISLLKPAPSKPWSFHWVVHFPLLEWETEEKRWTFAHNPFTSPLEEEIGKLETAPESLRSYQYDLVLNGVELASGSIRNHRAEVQRRIFSLMGYSPEQQEEQFGMLLRALEYGAPPLGGIALGLDRLAAILCGEESIREVIAFPKTQKGACPLSGSPSPVDPKKLKEAHIRLDVAPILSPA
jgi:aspartyl-tRNA synthetase